MGGGDTGLGRIGERLDGTGSRWFLGLHDRSLGRECGTAFAGSLAGFSLAIKG